MERGEHTKLKVLKLSIINEIWPGVCVTGAQLPSFIMNFTCSSAHTSSPSWERGGGAFPARLAPVQTSLDRRWGRWGGGSVCCPGGCCCGDLHPFTPPHLPLPPLPRYTTTGKTEISPQAVCTVSVLLEKQLQLSAHLHSRRHRYGSFGPTRCLWALRLLIPPFSWALLRAPSPGAGGGPSPHGGGSSVAAPPNRRQQEWGARAPAVCCWGERRRNWQGATKIIVSNRITEAVKTAISLNLVTVKSP